MRCLRPFHGIIAAVTITLTWSAARADVRFATGVDATFLTMVVAVDKGFMAKQGVKAEIKQFASGAVSLEAVVSGDADIAFASELAVLRPLSKGAKIAALARPLYSNNLMGIAAKKGIAQPRDFVGHTIGYAKGTASEYYLNLLVSHYQLDPKSFRLVNVAAPEMVPAMARGDIDVMVAWEPWFTRLRTVVPDTKVIAKSGDENVYTLQYLVMASQSALASKRDEVAKTMRALIEATDWLNDPKNHAEAAEILARTFHIPPADAELQLGQIVYTLDLDRAFEGDLRRAADWLNAQDLIHVDSVQKLVDDLIRPDLLRTLAPDRVRL